ncbi:protein SUS1 [Scheffersomyces coipomensis]|uniref:protein SUS1 n=1 Tax=Scheffersomyces coipomensis TaxID=1788519 RepID=UPI00315C6246
MTQQQEELDQIKSQIQDHLISSGNYDIINKQLKLKLYESGWYDKVSQLTNQQLTESSKSNGNDEGQINFDQLMANVKPKADELVSKNVKQEIMEKIKDYLEEIIQ